MRRVYITADDAAEYTGMSASYLAKLRMSSSQQVGPKYVRIGSRAIRYRCEDLDTWMQERIC